VSDPRTTLATRGLADARLQGLVAAPAYAPTTPMRCAAPSAGVYSDAAMSAEMPDELLFGEVFEVLVEDGDVVFGQARRDGYVGWVALAALSPMMHEPTHRVRSVRALVYSEPDLRSPSVAGFGLNALVQVEVAEGRFARAADAGWMVTDQLAPLGDVETDPVAVAERFLGVPYRWGGRDSLGLDCSGLVQQALHTCGRSCPRDTDQQLAALGAPIEPGALRRGDLVFWRGHVGLMLDTERLLHASGDWAAVAAEPLAEAVARIAARGGGDPVAMRRL
jgi:hypothetical protein